MDIKVLGMGCDKCDALYAATLRAVEASGAKAAVTKVEDLIEIVSLGVMTAPALMIDGTVVFAGRVPSEKAIIREVKKRM